MRERAVITGCGCVAPQGIGELTSFDASDTGRERAAEIHDFSPDAFLRSPKNYLDRNSALAFAACEMAIRESGATLPDAGRACGVAVGTMSGNLESLGAFYSKLREKGPKLAPPFLFPHTYYNTTAGLLSIEYGLTGPHNQFCSGAAAGLEAIAWAAECVALGRAPLMIAGGMEALSESLFRSALARGWLSPLDGGAEKCAPFAANRNGTILGEGAAFFVIESEAEAIKRGAKILALIAGIGQSANLETAMRMALKDAEIPAGGVGSVYASAGGYPELDEVEGAAIHAVFGSAARVMTPKSLMGETLGASGPMAMAAAMADESGAALVNAGAPTMGQAVAIVIARE